MVIHSVRSRTMLGMTETDPYGNSGGSHRNGARGTVTQTQKCFRHEVRYNTSTKNATTDEPSAGHS